MRKPRFTLRQLAFSDVAAVLIVWMLVVIGLALPREPATGRALFVSCAHGAG